jgi:hypothetical protein
MAKVNFQASHRARAMEPAPVSPRVYLLSAPSGSGSSAQAADADFPAEVAGIPAFYYWKDALTGGRYAHPTKGFSLQVTPARLGALANNFRRMKEAGIAVPILADHAERAEATLGFIVDVAIDNGWLRELHQFLGPNARDLGLRNGVSLGIVPDYVDGTGRHWGEAIVHSALTPLPIVPGQGPFEPAQRGEIWTLAMTSDSANSAGDAPDGEDQNASAAFPPDDAGRDDVEDAVPAPPDPASPTEPDGPFVLTPDQMTRLRALIPDADVLDAATLIDRLLDLLEAASADVTANAPPPSTTNLSAASIPAIDLTAAEVIRSTLMQSLRLQRDRLVERQALTPAAGDALVSALAPGTDQNALITLSHTGQSSAALATAVFDALENNHPAPIGEVTGLQSLARVAPGEATGGSDLPFRRMAERFNGKH